MNYSLENSLENAVCCIYKEGETWYVEYNKNYTEELDNYILILEILNAI